jgi:hypothetical protein
MKKIIIASLATTLLFSCNEKKADNAETKKENTSSETPKPTTNTGNPAGTATVESLPGAKKTGINIDKNPEFMVDGSQISRLSYKGDKGADINQSYYIQKVGTNITLTQVQVTRGEGAGLSKSVYTIDATKFTAADITAEEVKGKLYPNGKIYMINLSCKQNATCIKMNYQDIGVGSPNERMETVAQIGFEKKEDADKYLAILQAAIK